MGEGPEKLKEGPEKLYSKLGVRWGRLRVPWPAVMGGGGGGGGGGFGSRGDADEPVTPAGRFFLQPEVQQVINCAIGFTNPVDVPLLKSEIQRTFLQYHPRVTSLVVRDSHGREHWRPATEADLDKHVIVVPEEDDEDINRGGGGGGGEEVQDGQEDDQRYVNDYVAALTVSTPLSTEKPLWEVHVLPPRRRCCVLRLHHALGDGVALMSLFLACCERADDPALPFTVPGAAAGAGGRKAGTGRGKGTPWVMGLRRPARCLWWAVMVACHTLVYVADFLAHGLWAKDPGNPITGGAGVEMWPRRLVTASFSLDDLKAVKDTVGATINDVLVGVISYGLARYFELKSPKETPKDLRVTGLAMVNIRGTANIQDLSTRIRKGSKLQWGNQFGYVLLPIYLRKNFCDPLEYVTRAKAMLDRKKLSLEAEFTYRGGSLIMALLGPKVATLLNYRVISNTSFTFSNVVGPSQVVMFAKNPITYFRAVTNSLPHALTIHMLSYNGKADMQILVAKDIIHDPEVLVKCFQEALKEMKLSAITKI